MKRRAGRHFSVAAATIGVLLAAAFVTPAHAAPPPNDSITSPTVIPSIPGTFEQDTGEATAQRSDGRCVEGQSVWFRYRPAVTQRAIRVTTVGSDYDTVLAVFKGPRRARTLVRCNDDRAGLASAVRLTFAKGEKYWIAVSRCCSRGARGPGHAVLNLYKAAPLDLSVTVDSVEAGLISGRLIISGTAQCSLPSFVELYPQVSQRVGDAVARGWGEEYLEGCTDTPTEWRVTVDSETGWAFQEGQAMVSLYALGSDGFAGASDDLEATPFQVQPNPAARTSR